MSDVQDSAATQDTSSASVTLAPPQLRAVSSLLTKNAAVSESLATLCNRTEQPVLRKYACTPSLPPPLLARAFSAACCVGGGWGERSPQNCLCQRGRVVVCQPSITLPIAHPRCLAGACGGGAVASWAGRAPGHGGLHCHVGALPAGMYRLAHLTLRSTYMGAPVVVVGKLRDLHQPVHSTGACVALVLRAAVGRQL
jgi:hypothetical protein